jgi:virulence RhuM family protein
MNDVDVLSFAFVDQVSKGCDMTTKKQIEIYQGADGQAEIEVRLEAESVWLNRLQLAELFGRDVKTIGKHVNNVFREGELIRDAVVANIATTAIDGKTYQVEHYNLDVIISVGYRVKSLQGTQFRIWATQRLKEHLVHGYTLNRTRFEKNAAELEQALLLVQKAAQSPELSGDSGRGLVDVVSRYTQTLSPTAINAVARFYSWIFYTETGACSMAMVTPLSMTPASPR